MTDISNFGLLAQAGQPSRSASTNLVVLDDFRPKPTSHSALDNSRKLFHQEMREIVFEAAESGSPVDVQSFCEAFDFVEGMDVRMPMPSPSFEADGAILLEWAKRELTGELTVFSIIFHDGNYIFSSMSRGVPGANGALNCCDESQLTLYSLLSNNFMPSFHADVRSAR